MPITNNITITLDRRLIEHPRAFHLRRMRIGIWLYLDLLARLPKGEVSMDVDPIEIGSDMGLPEGTIRSWLGHLRRAGYIEALRLNGKVRVTIRRDEPSKPVVEVPTRESRPFTVEQLARALNAKDADDALKAVIDNHPAAVIRRALAGALAVPEAEIRRSRTALFLYLINRYAQDRKDN
jgi:DNA-binding transcriptional ArsR family regulator